MVTQSVFPARRVSQPGLKTWLPGGLNHRVWCFSDIEDYVCGFRGITIISSSARRMVPENGVSGFNGTLCLFIVPGVGQSGFNDVPVCLGPPPDGLIHTLDDARSRVRGEHGGRQPGRSATPQGSPGSRGFTRPTRFRKQMAQSDSPSLQDV
jgi:hypothetical protein